MEQLQSNVKTAKGSHKKCLKSALLCTTDDPVDTLECSNQKIEADPSFEVHVLVRQGVPEKAMNYYWTGLSGVSGKTGKR